MNSDNESSGSEEKDESLPLTKLDVYAVNRRNKRVLLSNDTQVHKRKVELARKKTKLVSTTLGLEVTDDIIVCVSSHSPSYYFKLLLDHEKYIFQYGIGVSNLMFGNNVVLVKGDIILKIMSMNRGTVIHDPTPNSHHKGTLVTKQSDGDRELKATKYMSTLLLGPHYIGSGKCEGFMVIEMENITFSSHTCNYKWKTFVSDDDGCAKGINLIGRLVQFTFFLHNEKRVIHGDMHLGNICFENSNYFNSKTSGVKVIDFGRTIIHVDESPDISLLLLLIECMYPLQGFFKLKIVHPVMDETTSRFIVPTSHNLEHISNHYNIMMQYRMYWRNPPFLSMDFKMFNGDFVFATMFKAVESLHSPVGAKKYVLSLPGRQDAYYFMAHNIEINHQTSTSKNFIEYVTKYSV
jgi:hypothetical protein